MFLSLIASLIINVNAATISEVTVDTPACYTREYSAKHMENHPDQTVQKFDFKFNMIEEFGSALFLDISALIKTDKGLKPYSTSMGCSKEGAKQLNCFIDCDGGQAQVSWEMENDGHQITFTNKGFVMYGGCGEEVVDTIWLTPKKGGDDVFKLNNTVCK